MIKLGQLMPLQPTSTACHCTHDHAQSHCSRHQLPVILHMINLGQLMPLQPTATACHSAQDQTWTAYAPAADISCLSFFTFSDLDRLHPCRKRTAVGWQVRSDLS